MCDETCDVLIGFCSPQHKSSATLVTFIAYTERARRKTVTVMVVV